jgi:hypothetical protein
LESLAAIPRVAQNRFLPVGDLGPPGSIDPEYLGALSPPSVRRVLAQADLARRGLEAAHSAGAPAGLELLPGVLREFETFLEAVVARGWGILILAS